MDVLADMNIIMIEKLAVCTRPIESNVLRLSASHADLVVASVEHSDFRLPDSDEIYSELSTPRTSPGSLV